MSRFCSSCGAQMRPDAAFCPQCGVTAAPAAVLPEREPERGNPRRALLVLAGLILLVALGYLGVTYYKRTGLFASHELYDFQLLSAAKDKNQPVFLARHDAGLTPGEMLESARKQCRKAAEGAGKGDFACMIMVSRWDSGFVNPMQAFDEDSIRQYIAKRWVEDNPSRLTALYIYDPDDSGNSRRPDDMLVLDCLKTGPEDPSNSIVCKDGENDWVSPDMVEGLGEAAADASAAPTEMPAEEAIAATQAAPAVDVPPAYAGYGTFHIVADANRRMRATASSSNTGRIPRGTVLQGTMVTGEDGTSSWLQIADGSGFVSSVNISNSPPPRLATMLGERRFRPEFDLVLFASPSERAPVIDRVPAGTMLVITGITDNGFAEAKGRSGGVGYFLAEGYDFSR